MKAMQKQFVKARQKGLSNMEIGLIRAMADKKAEEIRQQETERAFLYMLAIPLNVLVSDYWKDASKEKLQEFMLEICKLYSAVEAGVVTDRELADFLYKTVDYEVTADWLDNRTKGE